MANGVTAESALLLVLPAQSETGLGIRRGLGPEHRVEIAADAREGLRKALELRPDVIVTDLNPPGMTGAQLVREIRSRPDLDGASIVLLSGPGDGELRSTLLREGAQDYLKKPFSENELRSRITNVLAAKRTMEAEARLASLIEQAPDGIFISDLEGRYTHVNGAGCRMLGYTRDEIVGKTIWDLIPPEDAPRLLASRDRMLAGSGHIAEWTLRRKDGSFLPVEVSAKILPDGRWQGFVRDIGERKRLERALRTSEVRASGILSISADAIISVDGRQRITMFNAGAEKIFGYSRSEAIGRRLDILIPPRFRARHNGKFDEVAAGETTSRRMGGAGTEIMGLRKNGEEFPADVAVSKLEVEGEPILTATVRDVTERKRMEETLRRAIQARDEILGIVAHDLRNPLQSILGQAALLGRWDGGPERRSQRPVEAIRRAVTRMNHLIQELLDVTRLDAGRLYLQRTRVGAAGVVAESVESLRPRAEEAAVELAIDLPAELPDLSADRDRLLQVFENLIGNALKFTRAGGWIRVGAADRGGEVLFQVADSGRGIPPADLPHLFDRFWQARAGEGSGAGLGLAIVKGVVEAHGGQVWAESALGRGSTFFFTIPTAPEPAEPGARAAPFAAGTVPAT